MEEHGDGYATCRDCGINMSVYDGGYCIKQKHSYVGCGGNLATDYMGPCYKSNMKCEKTFFCYDCLWKMGWHTFNPFSDDSCSFVYNETQINNETAPAKSNAVDPAGIYVAPGPGVNTAHGLIDPSD